MIQFFLNASLVLIIFFIITALWYCISLSFVFKRLGLKRWRAFVLFYNIKVLIDALRLPKKWFVLAITPYISTVYTMAIAYRLGKMWGKDFKFSAFWLTIAAPIGYLMIGLSKTEPDFKTLEAPPPSLKTIKSMMSKK